MANWATLNTGEPTSDDAIDISVVTARIDNVEKGLNGAQSLTAVDVNGGAIDGTIIGANSATGGTFTSVNCTSVSTGEDAVKFDMLSSTAAIGSNTVVSMAHGHGNMYNAGSAYHANAASNTHLITWADGTNVYVLNNTGNPISSGTLRVVVTYI